MSCRDGFVKQRLTAHRLVTEDSKSDAVAFRIQAPIFKRQVGKHPAAAAGAGDGDDLAFQVGRGFDFRRGHDVADELVDDAGDEHQIHAFGGGAEHRAGGGAGMQVGFSRCQRRHTDGAVADDDKGQIQTVAAKESLVLGYIIDRVPFAEGAAGLNDFG